MSIFLEPERIDLRQINNRLKYKNGDGVDANAINAPIQASAYAQNFSEALADEPDITEIDGEGTPYVSLVDNLKDGITYKKFKFSNLRGKQGEKGEQGEQGLSIFYTTETLSTIGTTTLLVSSIITGSGKLTEGSIVIDNKGTVSSIITVSDSVITVDYLFSIKNVSINIENGDGEDSLIQSNGNNIAVTKKSISFGQNTSSGCRGYYYNAIDFDNKKIYLTETQPTSYTDIIVGEGTIDTSFKAPAYNIGEFFSIVNNSKYIQCASIEKIEYNVITYNEDSLGFTEIENPTNVSVEDFSFTVPTQPQIGVADIKQGAYANGEGCNASGRYSHAEGRDNQAIGDWAHVEGRQNVGYYACHVEGRENFALANGAHAEGLQNTTAGKNSHVEGAYNNVISDCGHCEGRYNSVYGDRAHSEGEKNTSSGMYSHTEGFNNIVSSQSGHAEGADNIVNSSATRAHAEGRYQTIDASHAHAEGYKNTITSNASASHAEGNSNTMDGLNAHVEGKGNTVSASYAHAEGYTNTVSGNSAHVEGQNNTVSAEHGHAEGMDNEITANGHRSHVEGRYNVADTKHAHVEGYKNTVTGSAGHAEGNANTMSGLNGHVEGRNNLSQHDCSHVQGLGNRSSRDFQHVGGQYNEDVPEALVIWGNGTSEDDRSNAAVIYDDGRIWSPHEVQASDSNYILVNKGYVEDVGESAKTYSDNADATLKREMQTYVDNAIKNAISELPRYEGEVEVA